MVESLDDALNSLIIEVARPLAGSLGEPEKATEWALRTSVIILAEAMQQRAADFGIFRQSPRVSRRLSPNKRRRRRRDIFFSSLD